MAATFSVRKIHHLESDSVHKAGAKEQAQFLAFPRRKRFIPSRSPADIDLLDTSRRPSTAAKVRMVAFPLRFFFQES
jgi:hypothetical protein